MDPETKSESAGQEANDKHEAFTHLAQGKRHLLVKDYNEAVTSLASACQLLSQLYGEFANECGEAYFNYGKALLELARTENGVLGIEGEGEESQDSEDDGEDEKEDKSETDGKNLENGKGDENQANENKDTDNTESESRKIDETNVVTDGESEVKDDGCEEDEVSNLRLAWEMLELAKIIFKRHAEGSKQMNLKLAEVHLKLGEVGLESENYAQAIDDIKTCLDIQIQNLDEHDRCIAETHYQLGMAYSLHNDFDESIEQLNQAHKLLEKRVDYLKEKEKQGATNSEQNESNPFYTIKDEIAELASLLPEVKEKISDMEDFKKETMKALIAGFDIKKSSETNSEGGQGTSSGAFPVSSKLETDAKPASDISHLVRKKRKLEPDPSEEKNSKQPRPDVSKVE